MVEIAGGQEVLGKRGVKSERIVPECIIDAQPEIIVLMPCGFSLDRTVQEYGRTTFFPGWNELPAVRDGQVYAVDGSSYFNRSGPRLIDGVEILSEIFHPRGTNVPNRNFKRLS
jgi:iron complex transport system substrate-binding protein